MAEAPSPQDIYAAAKREGQRRLSMPPLEQISTGFIAGVTIVFGIAALGVVRSLVEPELGVGPAKVLGALGFAIGVVLLVVGRSELFTENFFGPVAAAIDAGRTAWLRLARLWVFILALNLIGGMILVAINNRRVHGRVPRGAWAVRPCRGLCTASTVRCLAWRCSGVRGRVRERRHHDDRESRGGLLLITLTHTAQVKGARSGI